ncbi:MAG: NrfD/PsrC family molybdoenzyme membrane anchor subunit [Bacteroidales bacterium]
MPAPVIEQADEAKERRLDEIKRQAAETGRVEAPGIRPMGSPFPVTPEGVAVSAMPGASAAEGYYGLPLLKQPAWIWTVPLYLFVGGAAGGASVIAAASRWTEEDRTLAEHARWVALAGIALSPPLLVADLGRPMRFLAMLRVFKPQSPMSVGVWTLIGFSGASVASVAANLLRLVATAGIGEEQEGRPPDVRVVGLLAEVVAATSDVGTAAVGLVLMTYTGVLIAVTTVPVWARNVRLLPFHFGISGLASAVGILELLGHHSEGMWRIALGTSILETAVGARIELDAHRSQDPLRRGSSGLLTRIGGALSGPIPLALRLFGRNSKRMRYAAAACSIAGSLVTRFAWIEAGRVSARDPQIPLQLETAGSRG